MYWRVIPDPPSNSPWPGPLGNSCDGPAVTSDTTGWRVRSSGTSYAPNSASKCSATVPQDAVGAAKAIAFGAMIVAAINADLRASKRRSLL